MTITEQIPIAPDKKGPRLWTFEFNHYALRQLELVTARPAWAILVDPAERVGRLQDLAWCASASYRKALRIEATFDQWLEEGYLPDYMSEEWFEFQDRVTDLLNRSFPKAARDRLGLQTLTAAQTLSSLANTASSTGTSASTAPSESSECPTTSSGIIGIT